MATKIKQKVKPMPVKKPAPRTIAKAPAKKAAPVQRDIEDADDSAQQLVEFLENVPTSVLTEATLLETTRRVDEIIEGGEAEHMAALWTHVKQLEQHSNNVRRALEDAMLLLYPAQDTEGTEEYTVPGFAIKIVHKVTRAVDPEKLTELSEEYEIDDEIARLFRFKPELNLAVYRAEDPDLQKLFDAVITTKQSKPSFTITANDEE